MRGVFHGAAEGISSVEDEVHDAGVPLFAIIYRRRVHLSRRTYGKDDLSGALSGEKNSVENAKKSIAKL
jgi:hypothetical protein